MMEYETLGHMSVAPTSGTYFIPHHPVFKGDLKSSKLRVVFDASAVASSGWSLNQCLHIGPKLQQDIVDILLHFRVNQFTSTADICKMYRQITVLPKYRSFQHIFWWPRPLDELLEYQLNTVTYGLTCAPFLALRVLQNVADEDCSTSPEADTYVLELTVRMGYKKIQRDLKSV